MSDDPYKLSFSTGGLYRREAETASRLYISLHDWLATRDEILASNAFQSRTWASSGRTLRELLPRLALLNDEQLAILAEGSRQDQNQILWYAVCQQYRLINEFAVEVIREKVINADPHLEYADFDVFFKHKAEWHPELQRLTELTTKKLRQVLFRMLREAEILTDQGLIVSVRFSENVSRTFAKGDTRFESIFPSTDWGRGQ